MNMSTISQNISSKFAGFKASMNQRSFTSWYNKGVKKGFMKPATGVKDNLALAALAAKNAVKALPAPVKAGLAITGVYVVAKEVQALIELRAMREEFEGQVVETPNGLGECISFGRLADNEGFLAEVRIAGAITYVRHADLRHPAATAAREFEETEARAALG